MTTSSSLDLPCIGGVFGGRAVELSGICIDPNYQHQGIATALLTHYVEQERPELVTAYTRNPATVGLMNSVLIYLSPVSNTILMAPYAAEMPHAEEVAFRTYAHLNRYGDNGLYGHHDPADLPYGQAFATLKEQYPVLQHPGNALVLAGARQGSALEQSIYETRDYNFCGPF